MHKTDKEGLKFPGKGSLWHLFVSEATVLIWFLSFMTPEALIPSLCQENRIISPAWVISQ